MECLCIVCLAESFIADKCIGYIHPCRNMMPDHSTVPWCLMKALTIWTGLQKIHLSDVYKILGRWPRRRHDWWAVTCNASTNESIDKERRTLAELEEVTFKYFVTYNFFDNKPLIAKLIVKIFIRQKINNHLQILFVEAITDEDCRTLICTCKWGRSKNSTLREEKVTFYISIFHSYDTCVCI